MNSNMLRFLIREMLIHEVPLDQIGGFRDPQAPVANPDDLDARADRPSIAYGKSASLKFQEQAVELMKDIKEGWSIITLWDVTNASTIINEKPFKEWFKKQDIPPTSKVIVVVGEPFEDDFDTSEFLIVHDIIGHSISSAMGLPVAFDRQEAHGRVLGNYDWRDVAENVHKILPRELQLGGVGDKFPDICGAIFIRVKGIREKLVPEVQRYIAVKTGWNPKNPKENEKICNEASRITERLFEGIDNWENSFEPGIPTLVNQF